MRAGPDPDTTSAGIPVVSLDRRNQILSMPSTPAVHQELYRQMPFAHAVELADAAGEREARRLAETVRVLAWNAARCVDVEAFARLIESSRAEAVLLTEMDWGMARSGQVHTARRLAARLDMGHAFAVEFLELGLGDEREKTGHAGAVNTAGYHGAAVLCRGSLTRPRRVRLEESGGWFDGARGQRRVGGRIALCAVTQLGAAEIVLCSVHLESESDPAERLREMRLLFDEIDASYPGRPVVIGGDLNTFSISKAELDDPASVRRREAEDPRRFADPVSHEPLFALAEERGYEWKQSNRPGIPTHRSMEPRAAQAERAHPDMKLDWFLTRGVDVSSSEVLPSPRDVGRGALSDHDAVLVTVSRAAARR